MVDVRSLLPFFMLLGLSLGCDSRSLANLADERSTQAG
jgi:hypothetical protein